MGGLPLGLAHDVQLLHDVPAGQSLTWADVQMDTTLTAYRQRKEMEALFG
jgi:predicted homoserine dehydrogenase-like protein